MMDFAQEMQYIHNKTQYMNVLHTHTEIWTPSNLARNETPEER